MSADQKTFRFTMNGRVGQAYSVGAEHVGLTLAADGMTTSLIIPIDEAKAIVAALQAAITFSENL